MKIWFCKIGEVDPSRLPGGGDFPMREAVEAAYKTVTGEESVFLFSGWGGELTEPERAVVEDREPSEAYALAYARGFTDEDVERGAEALHDPPITPWDQCTPSYRAKKRDMARAVLAAVGPKGENDV